MVRANLVGERLPGPKSRARPNPEPIGDHEMNDFTPRAQQVLQLARKEADRFNHAYIGTEHILLG